MEKEYLTIQDVAKCLSIKESTIYTKISEIPHYRIGRLLRFKKQDIDAWMEKKGEAAKTQQIRTTRPVKRNVPDVDQIVRKAIDAAKGTRYNLFGKLDRIKGLKKGGENGAV